MSKEAAEYYRHLSEVYLCEIEDHTTPLHKIMIAKGVLMEIESDLNFFLKHNPPNERSDKQKVRIELLREALDTFSNLSTNNYSMKLLLRAAAADLNREKKAHIETQKNLESVMKNINHCG